MKTDVFSSDRIDIPRAEDIDYNVTDEVYAYYILMGKCFERFGGLNNPRENMPVIRALDRQAEYWLTEVERLLSVGPISAVPDLLEAYQFINLICRHNRAAEFSNTVRINTVKRWLAGDKTLTDTQIVRLLWPITKSDSQKVESRYSEYCTSSISSWIKELLNYGKFRNVSDEEAYQRLDLILRENLFAYVSGGKAEEKKKKAEWVKSYYVDDIHRIDTHTLRSYITLAMTTANRCIITYADKDAEYGRLFGELGSRQDLHPLYRRALKLDSENRKMLLDIDEYM